MRAATIVGLVVLSACGTPPPPPPPPVGPLPGLAERFPGGTWILLDEPRGDLRLGYAWDVEGGAFDSSCAMASDSSLRADGASRREVSWSSAAERSAHLEVVRLLGIEGAAERAVRGRVTFDTVFLRSAVDLYPLPSCRVAAGDRLPALPLITELIGAKRITIELSDSASRSLALEAATEIAGRAIGGGLADTTRGASEITLSYETPVFFGVRLAGYSGAPGRRVGEPRDSPMGEWTRIMDGWDARVTPAATRDRFTVIVRATGFAPARADTVEVSDGESFPVGRSALQGQAGSFLTAALHVSGGAREYRIVVEERRYRVDPFNRESDRARMREWIAARRGGP